MSDDDLKAGVKIQKEFADKRYRALNKGLDGEQKSKLQEKIEACAKRNGDEGVDWKKALSKITKALQKRNLTINFKGSSWFLKPNSYMNYTQMYQRSMDKDTKKPLLKGDAMNPAHTRAKADDMVTLPMDWKSAPAGTQRKKLWDAMSYTGATNEMLNSDTDKDIKKGMTYSVVGKDQTADGKSVDILESTNPSFNPNAKQVFTALNYGRRWHGSTTAYGTSHLILRSGLKKRSLYFPEDTFYFAAGFSAGGQGSAHAQVTYDRLGDLILWAKPGMQNEIWKSCYQDQVLQDTDDGGCLLEAHIFSDIQMGRDVDEVVLAREPGLSDKDWEDIQWHAALWCGQHAVRILF